MPCISRFNLMTPQFQPPERHPVPECGPDAYVCIRPLGAADLLRLQSRHGAEPDAGGTDFSFDLLAACLCDDSGELLFSNCGDAKEGFNLSMPALQALVKDCLAVSGIEVKEKN